MATTIAASQYLDEADWKLLLRRIKDKRCTPLLGPYFAPKEVPLPARFARDLAAEFTEFPFVDDVTNLSLVAQYIASKGIADPQEELQRLLRRVKTPDFTLAENPHRILAGLPFPVFVTTNQDNFLYAALKANPNKDARRASCRWWDEALESDGDAAESLGAESSYRPTPANPLIYHLFGHLDTVESLAVTEDQYLEFLANVSGDHMRIPLRIQQYFGGSTTMLFLGFSPDEMGFRVLLRSIVQLCQKAKHVAVQLFSFDDGFNEAQREEARRYLETQFRSLNRFKLEMRICWGDCTEFLLELNRRLENHNDD
jgi:hypothetical protein